MPPQKNFGAMSYPWRYPLLWGLPLINIRKILICRTLRDNVLATGLDGAVRASVHAVVPVHW